MKTRSILARIVAGGTLALAAGCVLDATVDIDVNADLDTATDSVGGSDDGTCSETAPDCPCEPGFETCDPDMPDLVCQTHVWSDPDNCGSCGNSCAGGACVNGVCQGTVDEDAHDAAMWIVPVIGDRLAMFQNGTIHAYTLDGMAHNVDPGGMPSPVMTPGGRVSIGDNNLAIGGYQDRSAVDQLGNLAWEWIQLGCCADVNNAIGGDGFFYTTNVDQMWAVDEDTPTVAWHDYGPALGHVSIAGDGVYVAMQSGELARWNRMTQAVDWVVPIAASALAPVAINHMDEVAFRTLDGEVGSVGPGGAMYSLDPANASAGPLIRYDHEIVIGTDFGEVQVWELPASGAPSWHAGVGPGPIRDLLLADGGMVIAATDDEIALVEAGAAQPLRRYFGLAGVTEMLLHQGILYVVGGGELFAIPIPEAWGYDLMSSWPVLHHDNRRTANRDKAQL